MSLTELVMCLLSPMMGNRLRLGKLLTMPQAGSFGKSVRYGLLILIDKGSFGSVLMIILSHGKCMFIEHHSSKAAPQKPMRWHLVGLIFQKSPLTACGQMTPTGTHFFWITSISRVSFSSRIPTTWYLTDSLRYLKWT